MVLLNVLPQKVQRDTGTTRDQSPILEGSDTGRGKGSSTAFVELAINQVVSRRFVKKQQMSWTLEGAHLNRVS